MTHHPNATPHQQARIDEFPFRHIYEAQTLSRNLGYSFVASVHGQKWRVWPSKVARLVSRGDV